MHCCASCSVGSAHCLVLKAILRAVLFLVALLHLYELEQDVF